MQHLIKILKAYLTKVFSDLHNIIFGTFVVAIILGGGGIYAYSQNLWKILENIAQSNTPIWATAALVLLVLEYTHIRLKNQSNSQNTSVKPKIDFIENGDLKWKVRLYPDGKFRIDDTPFCAEHDKFLYYDERGAYICFDTYEKDCKSHLMKKDYSVRIAYINALAEQKYRNT